MKKTTFRLMCLLLAAMPVTAAAQANIIKAFDAIIKCKDAKIEASHTMEKDPETFVKTGQCDVYNFSLPAKKINLIDDVTKAFDKDSGMAYSLNSGSTAGTDRRIVLAVSDGSGSGVEVTWAGHEYVYALFLAPKSEDATGNYRYAYALTYAERGDSITGRLAVTYATTLKHRQQKEENRQWKVLGSFSGNNYEFSSNDTQQGWFESLMSYFQSMTTEDSRTRLALATKAYRHIKDLPQYPEATDQDKNAAREILKTMISEKKYSDPVLNKLLQQCLAAIK